MNPMMVVQVRTGKERVNGVRIRLELPDRDSPLPLVPFSVHCAKVPPSDLVSFILVTMS